MTQPNPPKWPAWILRKICSKQQVEILFGDALEIFQKRVEDKGLRRAKVLFIRDILSSIRFFAMKKPENKSLTAFSSLYKNYFKSSLRSFSKNKLSSSINFLGLITGFVAALLIAQYAVYELSYDRFHKDYEHTFRVSFQRVHGDQMAFNGATTFLPVGPIMLAEYPEVYNQCRFYYPFTHGVINHENQAFHVEKPVFTEASYFEVFSYQLLEGDPASALSEPNSVVLSEQLANSYFGNKPAIGQLIRFSFEDGEAELKVTGVLENPRNDSHLKLDLLISMKTLDQWPIFQTSDWSLPFYHTYIQLTNGTDLSAFEKKSVSILEKFRGDQMGEATESFSLQPLKDIHLDSHLTFELGENGNRNAINFLILIAALILVIVYLNYINLTTALSSLKAKEVGIRKVMGSYRRQLLPRFLVESFLINIGALILACAIVFLTLRYVSQQMGIYFEIASEPLFWIATVVVTSIGAIFSSLYPAVVLSRYEPITVLRGKFSAGEKGSFLRKVLMSTQFAISVAMIGGMILIAQQTNYLLSKDLGFDSEKLLVISAPQKAGEGRDQTTSIRSFGTDLLNNANIHSFTSSSSVPGRVMSSGSMSGVGDKKDERIPMHFNSVYFGYFETYGITFAQGRGFSRSFPSDRAAVVLNAAAVQALGFLNVEEVVGDKILLMEREFEVIGVVDNYHHTSLKTTYEPIVFALRPDRPVYLSLNVNTTGLLETLDDIETKMKAHFPENPFEYFFLDQVFDQEFRAELRYGSLLKGFSILAIILAALGLFGLSSFLITQRTREIGIRKVLGATGKNLFQLLSSFFLLPLVLGSIIACFALYYFGVDWLNSFPFRIEMHWLVFIVPLAVVLLMTGATLGIQTLKALKIEPAETLKNE